MSRIRTILLLTGMSFCIGGASAAPPKIDRSIQKEPVYRTKNQKYGLLVFGPEGKDRVWLVLDGDTLYVDRNGNGDLTEPGEMVSREKTPGRDTTEEGYSFSVGNVNIEGRKYKHLTVGFTPLKVYADLPLGKLTDVQTALKKDPKAFATGLSIDVDMPGMKFYDQSTQASFTAGPIDLAGALQFAGSPAEAPVIHCGGPLQITFGAELPTLRVGRGRELDLVVGTPGVGPGTFAMLGYEGVIPKSAKPKVEITFLPAKAGELPIKEIFEIKDRC